MSSAGLPQYPAPSKRRKNAEFIFPKFPANSSDGKKWREAPRPKRDVPFMPKRAPGTKKVRTDERPGIIFLEMLDESLDIMLEETNRHGSSRDMKSYKWTHLTREELVRYLAVVLAMGMVPKNNYKDYWMDKGMSSTPGFKKVMSLRRFKQITQNLHFENEEVAKEKGWDKRGAKTRDTLYKIRRMWNAAFRGFRKLRAPARQLSVDEQMIKFCGQFYWVLSMPSKPIDRGIKVYCLAEAKTGYAHEGHIHSEETFPQYNAERITVSRVLNLLDRADVFGQNFELYTDSYYTSFELAERLLDNQVAFAGTLASGKTTDCPAIISDRFSPFSRQLLRGQALFLHTDTMSVCNFSDSSNVVFLYTLPDVCEEWTNVTRNLEHVKKSIKNTKTKEPERVQTAANIEIPQPLVAHLYNQNMGGVDLADQLCTHVIRYFRTHKWYKSVFHYLLITAACNTFIIRREGLSKKARKKCTVKSVREEIVNDLLQIAAGAGKRFPLDLLSPFHQCRRLDTTLDHMPVRGPPGRCRGHKQRRQSRMHCKACKVPLCIDCFDRYHSMENFKLDDPKKKALKKTGRKGKK